MARLAALGQHTMLARLCGDWLARCAQRCRQAWQSQRRQLLSALSLWLAGMLAFTALCWAVLAGTSLPAIDQQIHAWALRGALADSQQRPWLVALLRWLSAAFSTLSVLLLLGLLFATWLRKYPFEAMAIVLALLFGNLTRLLLMVLISRPRPAAMLTTTIFPNASFPSGHAVTTLLFVGWLTWVLSRRLPRGGVRRLLLLDAVLLTLLSGWSRIYLGAHWPTDILAAWLFAGAWLALAIGAARAFEQAGPT